MGSVRGRKLTLTAAFENVHGVWAVLSKGYFNSHVTSPNNGFDHGDDAFEIAFSRGTEGFPAHQAHAKLLNEVKQLHETLSQTQGMLDTVQTRLQAMKQQQPRIRGFFERRR